MMLAIEGTLCQFGEKSLHLMNQEQVNIGCLTLLPAFPLEKFEGVPIFGPDGKAEIGRVTRAFADGDLVRLEGEIRDRLEARYWITQTRCGLCAVMDVSKLNLREGVNNIEPEHICVSCVRIMLPGKAGYQSSSLKFRDLNVTYSPPVTDKPTAAPWFGGQDF